MRATQICSLALVGMLAVPATIGGEERPLCWAGHDSDGRDRFIRCDETKKSPRIVEVDLNRFEWVSLCNQEVCITLSREQLLAAAAGLPAGIPAKP